MALAYHGEYVRSSVLRVCQSSTRCTEQLKCSNFFAAWPNHLEVLIAPLRTQLHTDVSVLFHTYHSECLREEDDRRLVATLRAALPLDAYVFERPQSGLKITHSYLQVLALAWREGAHEPPARLSGGQTRPSSHPSSARAAPLRVRSCTRPPCHAHAAIGGSSGSVSGIIGRARGFDWVVLSRFDTIYYDPIPSLNIKWGAVNLAFRDSRSSWRQEHKVRAALRGGPLQRGGCRTTPHKPPLTHTAVTSHR